MTANPLDTVRDTVARLPFVRVCVVFGSVASGRSRDDSDLDIGIAAERPMSAEQRLEVTEALAGMLGRPIDLVDLLADGGPVLREAVTEGRLVYCADDAVWARVVSRMLFHEADFMPIYRRILDERRREWIGES